MPKLAPKHLLGSKPELRDRVTSKGRNLATAYRGDERKSLSPVAEVGRGDDNVPLSGLIDNKAEFVAVSSDTCRTSVDVAGLIH